MSAYPRIEPEALAAELDKSLEQGYSTEQLGRYFICICDILLTKPFYAHYSREDKEDMKGDALLKMIRSLKKYKPEMREYCFSFWMTVANRMFLKWLKKRYKYLNKINGYKMHTANAIRDTLPAVARHIEDTIPETQREYITSARKQPPLISKGKKSKGSPHRTK